MSDTKICTITHGPNGIRLFMDGIGHCYGSQVDLAEALAREIVTSSNLRKEADRIRQAINQISPGEWSEITAGDARKKILAILDANIPF